MARTVRIVGIATFLAVLFRISQDVGVAWGNEDVQGYAVALGVVSLIFGIRAAATEYSRKDVAVVQRDILWGITLGTFVAMMSRILR